MSRKTQAVSQKHMRDGIGAFQLTWNHRLSGIESAPNHWQIIEEKRENGEWVLHRYCPEYGAFDDIVTASRFAIAKATERRDEIRAASDTSEWRKMIYPMEFCQEVPRNLLPGRLPPDWDIMLDARPIDIPGKGMQTRTYSYFLRDDGLRVNMHFGRLADQKRWLHVAAAYSDETPDWETMCTVKDLFVGKHRYSLQVHPAEHDYVNISVHILVHILHIFTCIDGWPLPDFKDFVG